MPKKKKKKPLTVRQVLNVIDEVLVRQDKVSSALWDVLTALRGPDDPASYLLKETGTVHIRRAAFPKTTKDANEGNFGFAHGAQYYSNADLAVPDERGHFNGHLARAIKALELVPEE